MDFTANAGHTYQYWTVDPVSWRDRERLSLVRSCQITRDESELMGSAEIEMGEDVSSETYIREYIVIESPPGSGETERFCLGTHLVQTPTYRYNGKTVTRSMTCYTPLLELRDSMPPIGYTVPAGANISGMAEQLCKSNCRAPFLPRASGSVLDEPFVAADSDTWLSYISALLAKGKMKLSVDVYGRVCARPDRDVGALLPSWRYTDDNSSILMPDVTEEYDWYGVPNVYEAVLSKSDAFIVGRAVNDSEASPLSTATRGRIVLVRDTSPDVADGATQEDLANYAKTKLMDASRVERTIEYEHGYNTVTVGDGVELDYTRHGLRARGMVSSQTINCDTGCIVSETARYSENLWR